MNSFTKEMHTQDFENKLTDTKGDGEYKNQKKKH